MGRKRTRFQWDSETADEDALELPSRRELKREDNRYKAAVKSLLALKPNAGLDAFVR